MKLSLIVAAAENDVIGKDGGLPWSLSADLKRFKRLTMGHWIVMGRKTYESIGRLLPGRTSVIVTRQSGFRVEGAVVTHSLEQWVQQCSAERLASESSASGGLSIEAMTPPSPDQAFIIGGAEIYAIALPLVSEIHLTRVHANVTGDAFLPLINWNDWQRIEIETHVADEKNNFACSFEKWQRADTKR